MRKHLPWTILAFLPIFLHSFELKAQCGPSISTFPYVEDFESGAGNWNSGGTGNDWALGTPTKPTINSAGSGTKCWVAGGLTGSFYTYGERSFVESPCFDFTNLAHPYIFLKVWWESEHIYDGAVLQYSLDQGGTWDNVGSVNDMVDCLNDNWYNWNSITHLSGLANPKHGWSGNIKTTQGSCQGGMGSNGWVTAKHCMPYLAGVPQVKFRMAFGAGTTCNDFDGFAFDDVHIQNAPPIEAGFTYACSGPNAYAFTDTSTFCPENWQWNFGDPASGASNTSTLQNPSHTFSGPGVYTVSLIASSQCSGPSLQKTTQVTIMDLSLTATAPACNGDQNGALTASITPAAGNAIYSWNTTPAQSGPIANNLGAGTYTLSVSVPGWCPATATATLNNPPALAHQLAVQQSTCGQSNGAATITENGGTGAYTFNWNPAVTSGNTAAALAAGNYSVSIQDQNGCMDNLQFTINASPALQAAAAQVNAVSCFGKNDGSASANVLAGTPPYTYQWAPAGGNGVTASNLPAGTYTVTVTGGDGCTNTATTIVTEPLALQHSVNATDANCSGSGGSASITASGGTSPYSYQWAPSVSNGPNAANLGPGAYQVTVSDQNGCTNTALFNLGQTPGVTLSLGAVQNPLCHDATTGSINLSATGSQTPYTYAWSTANGNGPAAQNLGIGTYQVTVTDALGCTATLSATITAPPALSHQVNVQEATCGQSNGSANITESGGQGSYTFVWSPNVSSSNTASGLAAGNYQVTVLDQNACPDQFQVSVSNSAAAQVAFSQVTGVSCFGKSDGSATVSVSSGTPPYSYLWSPQGGTGVTASNLPSGDYGVTVTDGNGCASILSVNIPQPAVLQQNTTFVDANCTGAGGSANIISSGGTSPYTYQWSPAVSNGPNALNIGPGQYQVTVSDQHNCTNTVQFTIGQTAGVALALTNSQDPLCFESPNGALSVSASGSQMPYGYTWSTSNGNGQLASNLLQGTYTVTVTDALGCKDTLSATLSAPPALTHQLNVSDASCGQANGTAIIAESGGTAPYNFSWNPNAGTGNSASALAAGVYTVTVKDQHGCTEQIPVNVTGTPALTAAAGQVQNVSCFGKSDGSATINILSGTAPYVYQWSQGGSGPVSTGLPAGAYTVTLSDAAGCTSTLSFNITQPPVLQQNSTFTDAACTGTGGSAGLSVSGGTAPYTYQWLPAVSSGPTALNLSPGAYAVTITDHNGCSETQQFNLGQMPGVEVSLGAANDPLCAGSADGSISVSATGSITPYTYNWSTPKGSGPQAQNLGAGTYAVTVIDAAGCKDTLSAVLTEAPVITFDLETTPLKCPGDENASIAISNIQNGTSPYLYSLNQSGYGPNALFQRLKADTYVVSVQDASGCQSADTLSISNPVPIQVSAAPDTVIELGTTVLLSGVISDPGRVVDFQWQPAADLACDSCLVSTATPLRNTSYTLIVTDSNGCTYQDVALVRVKHGSVYIPNIIRPGSDDLNDYFTVYGGAGVQRIEFIRIYDRWGSLIFENNDFEPSQSQFGWDGRIRGQDAATGVYVYVTRVRFLDGQSIQYEGDVTVIR